MCFDFFLNTQLSLLYMGNIRPFVCLGCSQHTQRVTDFHRLKKRKKYCVKKLSAPMS